MDRRFAKRDLSPEARRRRDELVNKHQAIVPKIAANMRPAISQRVTLDELVSAGYQGLLRAAERFDPDRGFRFNTFAIPAIRGAIIDYLRNCDDVPRKRRQTAQRVIAARDEESQRLGRRATDDEVCERLGWPSDAFAAAAALRPAQSLSAELVDIEPGIERVAYLGEVVAAPHAAASDGERDRWFEQVTRGLAFREKMAVWLYYFREWTMREIAELLELSESRISQQFKAIFAHLRHTRDCEECFETMPMAG